MKEASVIHPAQVQPEKMTMVRQEIHRCVIGLRSEIDSLLCAILCGRHVLLESVPGLGKTLLVNTLAKVLGCSFRRIQFTPDLLPADILGGFVFNPKEGSFSFRQGPIFASVILADEINRAPAKTQSALLEAMQEHQVTIEGQTKPLDDPFLLFATQNPVEHEGVYPLPQAQLDRFAMRLILPYPIPDDEMRILALNSGDLPTVNPVLSSEEVIACQKACSEVTVSDEIRTIIVNLANHTRARDGVTLGASPRLGIDLIHLSRARAWLDGRSHVLPDDIKVLFHPVANHRLALTARGEISGLTVKQVINEALDSTELV
ncbi:AAA family ATPase [Candidatus Eisenbacteria bacterium]|uniref:AAA family ATPase n=1 Tax=Eiseniibacteriota bacterium TaxID=2212470 RepID=A0ABV6YIP8_UNCEI